MYQNTSSCESRCSCNGPLRESILYNLSTLANCYRVVSNHNSSSHYSQLELHTMSNSTLTNWLFLVGLFLFQRSSPANAAFDFTLNILSHLTSGCRSDICESQFSEFCLRGPRTGSPSLDITDCPLGRSDLVLRRGIATIASDKPWPVRIRQCFI